MTPETSRSAWKDCLADVRDGELRGALVALFDHAAAFVRSRPKRELPPLVVLVSRRLSCLYEMLAAHEFAGFDEAEVISDRALEAGFSDLRGRDVLLLDDVVIVGTTLVDLYDRIVTCAQEDRSLIKVMVAAIDEARYSRALTDRLNLEIGAKGGPVLRSTSELEKFALDVATTLYRKGVPYFSDFPMVEALSVPRSAVDSLKTSAQWIVVDVTPPKKLIGSGQRSFSLLPTTETLDRFRSRAIPEAAEIAETLKVRIYASPTGHDRASVRVVPIGIPGAMMRERLDTILAAMNSALRETGVEPFDCGDWDAPAKHRLLQMYLSSCLLAEFWDAIGWMELSASDRQLTSRLLERRHLDTYFGKEKADVVCAAFNAAVVSYRSATVSRPVDLLPPLNPRAQLGQRRDVRRRLAVSHELVASTERAIQRDAVTLLKTAVPPRKPGIGEVVRLDPFWVHRVIAVFGYIDRHLERKQELQLRTFDYERYRRWRDEGDDAEVGPRILKQGLTMDDIVMFLLPNLNLEDPWNIAVVSLAIDVGNDLGVIVPTTTCLDEHGPIFRQYRSGETAYLVGRPHEDVATVSTAHEAAEKLDVYTQNVFLSLTDGGPVDDIVLQFSLEMNLIREGALAGELLQVWRGDVIDIADGHVRAVVQSIFDDADRATARLPIDLLSDEDRKHITVGCELEWLVFEQSGPNGERRRTSQARLVTNS